MIFRRSKSETRSGRRTGPADETPWWSDEDQDLVESELIVEADLGKGWRRFPMVNNVEQLDPYTDGPEAEAVRTARQERRLTALDEGRAWRRRTTRALLVARFEMFAGPGDAHREAWRTDGRAILDATWRDRWRERDVTPGWIEARPLPDEDRPTEILGEADDSVDWLRVEDHTGGRNVAIYHHVTVWVDRFVGTLTLREDLGTELDPAPARAARVLYEQILNRRSDPRPGSA